MALVHDERAEFPFHRQATEGALQLWSVDQPLGRQDQQRAHGPSVTAML